MRPVLILFTVLISQLAFAQQGNPYLNDKGQWHQIGEVTADEGESWVPFLESILNRVE